MDYFAQFQAKNADLIVSEWKAQSPKRLSGQDEESIEDFLEYLWHWLESHSETLVETKGNLASKNWSPKSEQAAQVWRERGNEEFKKKSFKSAREFYTKGIVTSDPESQEEEVAGYANRSAALFELGHYQEALEDIARVLKSPAYPAASLFKIHRRRGLCLAKLGQQELATEALAEALRLCTVHEKEIQGVDGWRKQISEGDLKSIKGPATTSPKSSSPQVFLHQSVTEATQGSRGRHLMATEKIPVGTLLLTEKPVCWVLFQKFAFSHCGTCMKKSLSPVPCVHCSSSIFCNEACLSGALSWHQNGLCGTVEFQKLGLHHGSEALCVSLLQLQLGQKEPKVPFISNISKLSERVLIDFIFRASLLVYLLRTKLGLSKVNVRPVLENFGQVSCNSYAIKATIEEEKGQGSSKVSTQTIEAIGSGLYSRASGINHSCIPNALVGFEGTLLSLRSTEELSKGIEVTHSYGPLATRVEVKKRKQELLEKYLFDCQCPGCVEKAESPSNAEVDLSTALRCLQASCLGPISPSNLGLNSKVHCPKCGLEAVAKRYQQILREADLHFQNGQNKFEEDRIEEALSDTHRCLKLREEGLHPLNLTLGKTFDALGEMLASKGDYQQAGKWIAKSVQIVEKTFGARSIELTYELVKLSELEANTIRPENKARVLALAERTLSLCVLNLGEGHEQTQDIKRLRSFLFQS